MERCTICGSSSWCGRPCANDPMANTGGDMANREETMANSLPDMANTSEDMANSGDTKKTYRYRDTEKRREYQRELMRKRRAKRS